jgi:hypothetical protein
VELGGVLRREIHPGRPNYESVAAGDEAETGYYVPLTQAICIRSVKIPADPDEEPLDSVNRVQLVLDLGRLRAATPNAPE